MRGPHIFNEQYLIGFNPDCFDEQRTPKLMAWPLGLRLVPRNHVKAHSWAVVFVQVGRETKRVVC